MLAARATAPHRQCRLLPSKPLHIPNVNPYSSHSLRSARAPRLLSSLNTTRFGSSSTAAAPAAHRLQTRVDILSESLPFIQRFRTKTIVVKYGGAAMKSPALRSSIISDLVLLSCVGVRPILSSPPALPPTPRLSASSVRWPASTQPSWQTATSPSSLPWPRTIDAWQGYNVNLDTVAGEIAATVGVEKLILMTDVAGILADRNDPGSLVKEMDISGARRMVEGGVGWGNRRWDDPQPKVNCCCVRSLAQGVRTASIIDGRVPPLPSSPDSHR